MTADARNPEGLFNIARKSFIQAKPERKGGMTSIKLFVAIFSAMAISVMSCSTDSTMRNELPSIEPDSTEQTEPPAELSYIYREGTNGYEVFRIPAIVKTTKGTLLAFAEARKEKSDGDSGNIDLVLKRSEDGGKTWGDMILVWSEGDNTSGNPVPIVDRNTGKIHLLMTWNDGDDDWGSINNGISVDTRRVFYTWSNDDGLSWEDPEEITSDVKKPEWRWYGTGPVHGIQVREGEYKGRLVVPSYFTVMEDGELKNYSHMIFSDDGGKTWEPGTPTLQSGVGECTVAELPGGSLMLNMRANDFFERKVALSNDGGETWSDVRADPELTDPGSQASLLSVRQEDQHMLLFSNAASRGRVKMTVKISTDQGESWSGKYEVHAGPSAYSDLVMISENEIGLLFEGGIGRPYESIAFETIALYKLK